MQKPIPPYKVTAAMVAAAPDDGLRVQTRNEEPLPSLKLRPRVRYLQSLLHQSVGLSS